MHRSCFCEQENGGLAVLNLRVGQLLRQHNRCSAYFTLLTAIPLTLTLRVQCERNGGRAEGGARA